MKNSYKAYLLDTSARRTSKNKSRARNGRRTGAAFLSIFTITTAFFISGVLGIAIYMHKITSDLPRLEKEVLTAPAQTTKIYSQDGVLLADLHAEENRVLVPIDSISPWVKKAVIAIEDDKFYQHKGVNLEAVVRSILVDIAAGAPVQGGSTITQQYVRNIYLERKKTIERKIKEMLLAYEVEKLYSKDTILEKYLNTIYFGHGCYGIETASLNFFGKHAKELSLPESALLAGMVKGPLYYTPYNDKEAALNRRNTVLKRMFELGYINSDEYDKALKTPVKVKPLPKYAYYAADYFVEYVKKLLLEKYGEDLVFKGGLRVHTTIDMKLQKVAEKAVFETLDLSNDPDASLVSIDVNTGHILAMVGGEDFLESKFNLAVQGRRQPGSAYKTFVLVAALESGISPYETYESSPLTIKLPGSIWKVSNAEGGGRGQITLRNATVHSVNAVYARLVMDVGAEKVVDISKRMGIRSNIQPFPSIALGSQAVSPLDMASAYATLARGGKYIAPIAITKILDSDGRIIEEFKPKPKQVIEPWIAYTVTDILQDVIRHGTGTRARISWPAAGKTGTAQEYRDAWFAGYTPQISTAVWVGYRKAQISMRNIHGFGRVYGGTLPAMIWRKYMVEAMKGKPKVAFERPKLDKNVIQVKICKDSGLLATPFCPNVRRQMFLKGKGPKEYCDIHKGIELPDMVGMVATDAINYLKSKKINSAVVNVYSDKYAVGLVVQQTPSVGTPIPENSSVTLYVSKGPKPEPPPPPPPEPTTSSP